MAYGLLALGEYLTDQGLEGLCQGRIRDVGLVLVEFAGREQPMRRNDCLVQLVYHGGLANAGIPGDEHERRRPIAQDPVEGGEQGGDLGPPPIELLRDQQSLRRVVRAQWERIDAAIRFQFSEAPPKIGFHAGGRLVALLSVLGEELHGQKRQRFRDSGTITRRRRLAGNVAVHPLEGIGGGKRQRARQHLVHSDAQRVQVAPGINRPIHPARLFGRHIGQRTGNDLRRRGRLRLARKPRRDPKSSEPDVVGVVDEHVRRLDVLMNEALAVHASERGRQANGDAQGARQFERLSFAPLKDPIQGLAAGIREDEHRLPVATGEFQRPGCPRRIKVGGERAFVLELPEALGRRLFCGGCDDQDGGWVTRLVAAVQRKLPAVPQRLEQITNVLGHRARS